MEIFLSMVTYLLVFTSILLVVALGGMFSEKSGTVALSLEGSMTIGALAGGLVMYALPGNFPPALGCLIAILASLVAGCLYSLLLAVASILFKADQTLVGTALNVLSTAIAIVLCKRITASPELPTGQSRLIYMNFYEYFNVKLPNFPTVRFNWLTIIVLGFALMPVSALEFDLSVDEEIRKNYEK